MQRKLERAGGVVAAPTSVDVSVAAKPTGGASPVRSAVGAPTLNLSPRGLGSTWANTTQQRSGRGPTDLPPYRRHLEARERELHEYIQSQMVAAVEDQRRDEAVRAEACRLQRDVERMKLRQRTKQRVELQAQAKQPVPEETAATLGVDLHHADGSLSATAQHRRELRDVPARAFVEHNSDRLAVQRREACREAERLKAAARVAMEEYVGTEFAKKRAALWERTNGKPADSVRCPTAHEQRSSRIKAAKSAKESEAERLEMERAAEEVRRLDEALYATEQSRREKQNQRVIAKDVPFDLNADFHRRRD